MRKKALLCVSFGTSYPETLCKTIGAIEQTLAQAFPDYEVRRAFTSSIIRKYADRDGIRIDDVPGALRRLISEGVREVILQPTHMIPGFEYEKAASAAAQFADQFDRICLGAPLLASEQDYDCLAAIISELAAPAAAEGAVTVYMGHGTEHDANAVYAAIARRVAPGCFIGTVEAKPDLNDVLEAVRAGGMKKVVLRPMMIVAGDHATNDMAGDDADSWKSVFAREGFQVSCVREGLGQIPAVQQMFVSHARQAVPITQR